MATTNDFSTTPLLGINFQEVFTPGTTGYPYTPDYPSIAVGTEAMGTDGTAYEYVLASGAIAVGDVVSISTASVASSITTTNASFGNHVGVAQTAIPSASYGWVARLGPETYVNVAGLCAPFVQLATTSVAGVLDDAVTTGTKNVTGIIITATNTLTSTVAAKTGTLNWPIVGATNGA